MPVVNARVRTLRSGSCAVALLLLAAAAAPASDADDLVGELEGILDAELATCDDIKKITDLDELTRARALVSGVKEASELDLAGYEEAERELREAQKHLKSVEDKLAERLSKVRLEARSAVEYEQGKVNEQLAKAKPIEEAIGKLKGEIAALDKTIDEELKKIAKMSWIEQQTAKQPAEEQARVKALREELAGKETELQPIAQELAPHKQALDDHKANLQAAEQKVEAEFKARLAGARAEVARIKPRFDGLAKKVTDARAGAVAPQLQRPGLLKCIADREDELIREGLDTSGTTATTETFTTGGAVVEHAPGSQPFSTAGFEGKAWPGTWEVTCDEGDTQKRRNGVGEFRFAGGKVSMLLKRLWVEDPAKADTEKPMDIPLDELGAFAFQSKDEAIDFGMSGQFQIAAGADGAPRPSGTGKHRFSMDLSFLAGMFGSMFTMGVDTGEELTPEQREEYMLRCTGTWDLPQQ